MKDDEYMKKKKKKRKCRLNFKYLKYCFTFTSTILNVGF